MIKKFTELLRAAVLSHLLIGVSIASESVVTYDLILPNIKIGEIEVGEDQDEDLISDINVKIFENGEHSCNGKNLVAVHGFTNTGNTWKPFAESLFADNPAGKKVCKILAVDLPGRGGSTVPENTAFGYLTLENHVNALKGTLSRLAESGYKVKSIVAHSQGALLMQMLQQSLIDEGTNLKKAHKVKKVTLLAPSVPSPVSWDLAESGLAAETLQVLELINLATLQVEVPNETWPFLFFTADFQDPNTLVANAPTKDEVDANGYNASEPLTASFQLVGTFGYSRPFVDAVVFADEQGTTLNVVSFQHDSLIFPDEALALFQYLTGRDDEEDEHYVNVMADDAIHSMYISNPSALLQAIAATDVEIP